MFSLDNPPYELFTLKHNSEKTNPEYFKIFLKDYHLKAGDLIYFEHSLGAVASTESIGIRSCHYYHENRDLIALKNFIDENIT